MGDCIHTHGFCKVLKASQVLSKITDLKIILNFSSKETWQNTFQREIAISRTATLLKKDSSYDILCFL